MSGLVLSQPMLLPWLGMFEQVKLCREFIFYDDVQLPLGGGKGRGFLTRVQIKTERGIDWLSLPVNRSGKGAQQISDATFSHMDWKREHLSKIAQVYRGTPHFKAIYEGIVEPIYQLETNSVSTFCMSSMQKIWQLFGFSPTLGVSSQLGISTHLGSSERVLAICKHFGAVDYISGLGAMNYIDYELFEHAGVRINYMNYGLTPYPQPHGAFTPYVSVLDALFNIGTEAAMDCMTSKYVYWRDWPHMLDGRPTPTAQ